MNEFENNPASAAVQRIQDTIDELPGQVAQSVWDEVSSTTPFGASLRQNSGEVLVNYLATLTPEDMGFAARRLIVADQAFGNQLDHFVDCQTLLTVINAVAALSDKDEMAFRTTLQAAIPAIPGLTTL